MNISYATLVEMKRKRNIIYIMESVEGMTEKMEWNSCSRSLNRLIIRKFLMSWIATDIALNDLLTWKDTSWLFLMPKLARQTQMPMISKMLAISLT